MQGYFISKLYKEIEDNTLILTNNVLIFYLNYFYLFNHIKLSDVTIKY